MLFPDSERTRDAKRLNRWKSLRYLGLSVWKDRRDERRGEERRREEKRGEERRREEKRGEERRREEKRAGHSRCGMHPPPPSVLSLVSLVSPMAEARASYIHAALCHQTTLVQLLLLKATERNRSNMLHVQKQSSPFVALITPQLFLSNPKVSKKLGKTPRPGL